MHIGEGKNIDLDGGNTRQRAQCVLVHCAHQTLDVTRSTRKIWLENIKPSMWQDPHGKPGEKMRSLK